MKATLRQQRQKTPAARWKVQRIDALLALAGVVAGVLILREVRREEVGSEGARPAGAQQLAAWAPRPGTPRMSSDGGGSDAAAVDAGDTPRTLPHVDNSSEIDGAPPVPVEAAGASPAPTQPWPQLAPEHMPEARARGRAPAAGALDAPTVRYQIESLLTADPEALQQARAMLAEPDPAVRAKNLEILADSFGLE